MQPTFWNEAQIIARNIDGMELLNNTRNPLRIGQVVVAEDPQEQGALLIKRVAYLAGDTVTWKRRGGLVHYQGVDHEGSRAVIQPGYVWLEGDNRDQSIDSRVFGPVPIKTVNGLVPNVIELYSKYLYTYVYVTFNIEHVLPSLLEICYTSGNNFF